MNSILERIIKSTQQQVQKDMETIPLNQLRREAESMPKLKSSFSEAISKDGINIIAEVKKASPSKGLICHDFNYRTIAREYACGGAAAVSVLTEENFFKGRLNYLDDIATEINIPLLRKDFIIQEYQIYQARVHRASAVLLLAAALDIHQLINFVAVAQSCELDVLLEVHNDGELEMALRTPAQVIGVNNRDLKDFSVKLETSAKLSSQIPADRIKISESGIATYQDIEFLQCHGYSAFLVGESLMRQNDRIKALHQLRGL